MPPATAYNPDDARITVAALEYLRTPEGTCLRQAVAELPAAGVHPSVAQVAALRKRFPAEGLHAALTLAAIQPKAAAPHGKFPELTYAWATPEALEQATHSLVARHKAQVFSHVKPGRIFDLCAGIGGDTLALADIAPVTAVDLSAVRTKCLAFNAADRNLQPHFPLDIRTGDVRDLIDTLPRDAWVHIDPARRSAGRRSPEYHDLIPGPDVLERIFARVQGGAIKLSPAVDFASLPAGHLELISHHGTVVQALLWLGPLGRSADTRTATILADTLPAWTFEARPSPIALQKGPVLQGLLTEQPVFFYELDGSLTRAGLAHAYAQCMHLTPVTVDGGYLVSEPGAPAFKEPALTSFHIQAVVPFSIARVAKALHHLPPAVPGPVEVKSRGHQQGFDTDHLQKVWSKSCPFAFTVLLFRYDEDTLAVIASRLPR